MSFLLGWKVVERKEAVFGILADVSIRMITAKKSIFQKSAAFRICFPSSSSQPPPKDTCPRSPLFFDTRGPLPPTSLSDYLDYLVV